MRRTVSATLVGTAILGAAGSLHAQASTETRRANSAPAASAPAPAKRPRVGYAGTPAPAPAPAPVLAPPVYYYHPDAGYYGSGYIITGAPYVVLQDGSVAANFGNGYERVLRPCATASGVSPSHLSTGRDALGRILPPPGIAALQEGSRGQLGGTMPARNTAACYRSDAYGRLEVVQGRQ
jgi:hypothetical protein